MEKICMAVPMSMMADRQKPRDSKVPAHTSGELYAVCVFLYIVAVKDTLFYVKT